MSILVTMLLYGFSLLLLLKLYFCFHIFASFRLSTQTRLVVIFCYIHISQKVCDFLKLLYFIIIFFLSLHGLLLDLVFQ